MDHRSGARVPDAGSRGDQPFFLWVSYVHPHHPFNPPAPYDTLYDPADMPLPVWDEDEVERWPEAYRRKFYAPRAATRRWACAISPTTTRHIKAYYYGMISQIDANIGRLLDDLRERGATGEHDHRLHRRPRREPGRPPAAVQGHDL